MQGQSLRGRMLAIAFRFCHERHSGAGTVLSYLSRARFISRLGPMRGKPVQRTCWENEYGPCQWEVGAASRVEDEVGRCAPTVDVRRFDAMLLCNSKVVGAR